MDMASHTHPLADSTQKAALDRAAQEEILNLIPPVARQLPTDTRQLAVEARGLVKSFDGTRAVDGVDLSVPEGAIYGVLGPNGAGKTTTLRMLLGIIDPDEGVRRVFGHDRPHDIGRWIGYLPEERGLYPAMKCDEAIAFMGALRGLSLAEGRARGRELLERHGLGHDGHVLALRGPPTALKVWHGGSGNMSGSRSSLEPQND